MKRCAVLLLVLSGVCTWGVKGVAALENNQNTTASSGGTIMFLGASYVEDWPIIEVAGKEVVNRGVGGNQSHEMLARMSGLFSKDAPDAVLIWGFINDIFRADREKIGETLRSARENFEKMVSLARASGVEVILATEVTMSEPERDWKEKLYAMAAKAMGKTSYQDYINMHVRETNEWLRQFAAKRSIKVLEFERTLSNGDGFRKKEFADEDASHLTSAGYDALTLYIRSELKFQ